MRALSNRLGGKRRTRKRSVRSRTRLALQMLRYAYEQDAERRASVQEVLDDCARKKAAADAIMADALRIIEKHSKKVHRSMFYGVTG